MAMLTERGRRAHEQATNPGYRVTLEELAGAIGIPVDHIRGFINADDIAPDWRGDLSVSTAAAARVVADRRAARELELRNRAMFGDYEHERGEKRAQVMREAAEAARQRFERTNVPWDDGSVGPSPTTPGARRLQQGSPPWQAARTRAQHEAALRAGEEFDRKNPGLALDEWIAKHGDAA